MKLTATPAVFLESAEGGSAEGGAQTADPGRDLLAARAISGGPGRGSRRQTAFQTARLQAAFYATRLQAGVSCLSALLILGNLISVPLAAQAPPVVNVLVVEGEGAVNNVKTKMAKTPVIQVEDENHRPISGAAVVFFLPDNGASGVFMNGSRTLTVTTDAQGRASAAGIKTNNLNGPMQIRVTASYQGQTASAVVNETNEGGSNAAVSTGMGSGTKWAIILLIVGGAAAGGIVAATHGGGGGSSSASATPAIVITAGTPSVGAPKQ